MAPTPDRGPRLGLVVGLCLVVAGAGVAVFALLASSESAPPPPPAKAIASALESARPASEGFIGYPETELALGDDCLRVAVADDEAERGQGLRGRDLGPYDGMLFVNESDTTAAYTMSGVTVPLDIGWYTHDGEPVDRTEMEPCPEGGPDCPLYSADSSYRFALETLRGELPTGSLGGCPS
ncbi:MAG: DUF192 domain-containing protein [Actinobacteria bacterium]|nr:DUF192 domain-containing protein [Actinomycetota bacterium]